MKLRMRVRLPAPRTAVRYGFLLAGLVCLGLYGYAYCERELYQAYASWEFDRTAQHAAAAMPAVSDPSAPAGRVVRVSGQLAPSPKPPLPAAVIGRLSVPRLHLSAMVREGVDRHTLRLAVGHIPATALPGQAGNIGVAGHRDSFFRGLKDLKTGDEIQFSTSSGNFKYVVESLTVVEPDDVGVLAPTAENVLTMVTCYPFSYVGNAPKRFIARARQVPAATAPPLLWNDEKAGGDSQPDGS